VTRRKHENLAEAVPTFVKTEGGMTYFTFLGFSYRTDSVGYLIQAKDGSTWNQTYSARVSAAAKQILEQINAN
jgi:hypothetical protein